MVPDLWLCWVCLTCNLVLALPLFNLSLPFSSTCLCCAADTALCGLLHHSGGQMGPSGLLGVWGGVPAPGNCGCPSYSPDHDCWRHLWCRPRHHCRFRGSHWGSYHCFPNCQIRSQRPGAFAFAWPRCCFLLNRIPPCQVAQLLHSRTALGSFMPGDCAKAHPVDNLRGCLISPWLYGSPQGLSWACLVDITSGSWLSTHLQASFPWPLRPPES